MTSKEEIEGVPKLKDAASCPLWELEVTILFAAKQLTEIVEGTITLASVTSDETKKKQWLTKDAQAKYIIMRTINPNVKSNILTAKTSIEMFDTLSKGYKKDTDQTKNQLLSEFFSFNYDKSSDLMSNISHIQNLS